MINANDKTVKNNENKSFNEENKNKVEYYVDTEIKDAECYCSSSKVALIIKNWC